jgi:protein phosphatase
MAKSAWGTDVGKKRTVNEDAALSMDDAGFYMIADGVGGPNSGEIASNLAVELMKECVLSNRPDQLEESELTGFFSRCLQNVNDEIYDKAMSVKENTGMATTAVMMLLRNNKAFIANIGDSRAYVLRDGNLHKITEDHTYVNELLRHGHINKEEAEDHPKKHMITRALGSGDKISPDFYQLEVFQGDRILLCTDGLYNEVNEEEISNLVVSKKDLNELVKSLIETACHNGGKDNITVNCVEI